MQQETQETVMVDKTKNREFIQKKVRHRYKMAYRAARKVKKGSAFGDLETYLMSSYLSQNIGAKALDSMLSKYDDHDKLKKEYGKWRDKRTAFSFNDPHWQILKVIQYAFGRRVVQLDPTMPDDIKESSLGESMTIGKWLVRQDELQQELQSPPKTHTLYSVCRDNKHLAYSAWNIRIPELDLFSFSCRVTAHQAETWLSEQVVMGCTPLEDYLHDVFMSSESMLTDRIEAFCWINEACNYRTAPDDFHYDFGMKLSEFIQELFPDDTDVVPTSTNFVCVGTHKLLALAICEQIARTGRFENVPAIVN